MESCLTLVRATYTAQNDMIQDFVTAHPTQDTSRLISKILAQMMMLCNGAISVEQIDYLQEYKMNPGELDYYKPEFKKLVDIDFEPLKFVPADPENPLPGEGEGPVDMTPEEVLMTNEVEEYSDELKRQSDEELR